MSWFSVLKDIDSATDKVAEMFTVKFENDEKFAKMMMDSILSDIKQGKSMQEVINEVSEVLSSSENIREFLLDEQFMEILEPDALSEIDFIKVAEEIVPPIYEGLMNHLNKSILKGFLPNSKTKILKLLSDELALPTFLKDLQTSKLLNKKKTMQLLNQLQKEGPIMIEYWNDQEGVLTPEEQDIAVGNFNYVKLILEKIAERNKSDKQTSGSLGGQRGKNIDELYRIFDELKENPSDELYQQAETILINNGDLRKISKYNHCEKYSELVGNIPENYKWLYKIFGIGCKYTPLDDYNCAQVAKFYEIVTVKNLLPKEIQKAYPLDNPVILKNALITISSSPTLNGALRNVKTNVSDSSNVALYPDVFYNKLPSFLILEDIVEDGELWDFDDITDEEKKILNSKLPEMKKQVEKYFDKVEFEDISVWQTKPEWAAKIKNASERMEEWDAFDTMDNEEWRVIENLQPKTYSELGEILRNQGSAIWDKPTKEHKTLTGLVFIKILRLLGWAMGEEKLKDSKITLKMANSEYKIIREKLMDITKEHLKVFADKFKTLKDKTAKKVFENLQKNGLLGGSDE